MIIIDVDNLLVIKTNMHIKYMKAFVIAQCIFIGWQHDRDIMTCWPAVNIYFHWLKLDINHFTNHQPMKNCLQNDVRMHFLLLSDSLSTNVHLVTQTKKSIFKVYLVSTCYLYPPEVITQKELCNMQDAISHDVLYVYFIYIHIFLFLLFFIS